MTRELLDKLSGGNKAGLLLDVLNQDEVDRVIADYPFEHNDFATISMVEVKSELNSQEDLGSFFTSTSTLGSTNIQVEYRRKIRIQSVN